MKDCHEFNQVIMDIERGIRQLYETGYEDGVKAESRSRQAFEEYNNKYHKWIPVTEKLPELSSHVLICLDNGYVSDDYFGLYGEVKFENFKYKLGSNKIVAWMPLPEPYKETH